MDVFSFCGHAASWIVQDRVVSERQYRYEDAIVAVFKSMPFCNREAHCQRSLALRKGGGTSLSLDNEDRSQPAVNDKRGFMFTSYPGPLTYSGPP